MSESETYAFDVSIVIVSFNTREVLRDCLRSIERESEGLRVEVLVVDNDSSDGSAQMVREEFPGVCLIESEINLGFGPANNVALRAARGRYVVLLNSDAFLCPGALRIAVDHMDKALKVGLAGARLIGRDFSWQPSARMFPNLLTDFFVFAGLAYRYPKSRLFGRFDRTWANPMMAAEVDWVPGAFSIIRAEVLAKVGFFDPRFFLYSEEVDLCRRIRNAGYQNLVLARYSRHPCGRRIVASDEESGDLLFRIAAGNLAYAKHSALLPQASWRRCLAGKVG